MAEINVGQISEALNNKADLDGGNVIASAGSKFRNIPKWSSNITNCITEIPQDIKLELNNGTLTLKSGSKLYIPNGFETDGTTKKFNTYTFASDTVIASYVSLRRALFLTPTQELVGQNIDLELFSGTSAPTGYTYMVWYDTTNNLIKYTTDSGSTWVSGNSFPFASVSGDNSTSNWTSIDQVFNGFGYIGSTMFALPSIKGLIPNGRNADGSLKSIPFTTSKVLTFTWNTAANRSLTPVVINENELSIGNTYATANGYRYLEKENILYTNNQNMTGWCYCGDFIRENDRISFFKSSSVYHSLNYSDNQTIVGWGMPDYSAGISISTFPYTVPCDGFIKFGVYGSNYGGITINNSVEYQISGGSYNEHAIVPVAKGDTITTQNNNRERIFYPCRGAV